MTAVQPSAQIDQSSMWQMLSRAGLPVCDHAVSRDDQEILELCARIGYPVVMKAVVSAYAHKTEGGGVLINLAHEQAARDGLARLRQTFSPEVDILVQRYLPAGRELLVSAMRTPGFGIVVALGLGGIHTESLRRVAFRLAPVSRADIDDVLAETALTAYAGSARGLQAIDLSELADCVNGAAAVLGELDDGAVVELNPVHAGSDGRLTVVDCRIVPQGPGGAT